MTFIHSSNAVLVASKFFARPEPVRDHGQTRTAVDFMR